MSSSISSYLPPADGFLPKWLLFVSIVSLGNSIQSYSTLHFTKRIYNPNPASKSTMAKAAPEIPSQVTPLSARTFGTWTAITAIVRLYAAYNIENEVVYKLALWTYVVAWSHFVSEWLVFKTARWGMPLAGPFVVATSSLIWMWLQWDFYVGQ